MKDGSNSRNTDGGFSKPGQIRTLTSINTPLSLNPLTDFIDESVVYELCFGRKAKAYVIKRKSTGIDLSGSDWLHAQEEWNKPFSYELIEWISTTQSANNLRQASAIGTTEKPAATPSVTVFGKVNDVRQKLQLNVSKYRTCLPIKVTTFLTVHTANTSV